MLNFIQFMVNQARIQYNMMYYTREQYIHNYTHVVADLPVDVGYIEDLEEYGRARYDMFTTQTQEYMVCGEY